jgi:predicted homoserine dehydrogenase-like protein
LSARGTSESFPASYSCGFSAQTASCHSVVGYTVCSKLVPVARGLTEGALPIGLANGVRLTRDVAAGTIVRMSDVALDQGWVALKLRREMVGKTGIASAT